MLHSSLPWLDAALAAASDCSSYSHNCLQTCFQQQEQLVDLEPLPLFSPTCYDTLRAVNPNVFQGHEDGELLEPRPLLDKAYHFSDAINNSAALKFNEQEHSVDADSRGPSAYDVVCSRAKQFYGLPGCQRFQQIVRSAIPAYSKAYTRLEKSSVIAATIDAVINHPDVGAIRFWKFDHSSDTWRTLNSDQIRDKVGHAIREVIQEMNRTQRKKMLSIRQVVVRAS